MWTRDKARHVYFPALRAGLSKNQASALCFLLSAVFHELLVSVPFHMVSAVLSYSFVFDWVIQWVACSVD